MTRCDIIKCLNLFPYNNHDYWLITGAARHKLLKYSATEDAVYEQYRNVQEVFYKGIFDGTEFL